jgi:hypothetical protein
MVLALGSVAVGCGNGQPAPQAQGEVAGPVTKPRVAAFARKVRLRASDLPGATVLPAKQDRGEDLGEQFSDCIGSEPNVPTVAFLGGPTFLYGERDERAAFSSDVGAAPTPYEAKAMTTLFASRQGFRCLRRAIRHSFRATDGEARDLSIARLSTPLPPTPTSFGIRIGATLVEGEKETSVFVDSIDFVSGPTVITLTAIGSPTPVNQIIEAGLTEILYSRALNTGF